MEHRDKLITVWHTIQ